MAASPVIPVVTLIIFPNMLRASRSRFKARLVRSANNKEMGAVKDAVGKDALVNTSATEAKWVLKKNTVSVHTNKTLTVGSTARAVGDVGHDRKCRVYRSRDRTWCVSQSSLFHFRVKLESCLAWVRDKIAISSWSKFSVSSS